MVFEDPLTISRTNLFNTIILKRITNIYYFYGKSYGLFFDLSEEVENLELISDDVLIMQLNKEQLALNSIQINGLKNFYLEFKSLNNIGNSLILSESSRSFIKINHSANINGSIFGVNSSTIRFERGFYYLLSNFDGANQNVINTELSYFMPIFI